MKYDKKIKNIITILNSLCIDYLTYVNNLNECAYSDRMLESIIDKAKELEQYHKKRFENHNKIKKNKKDLER